MKALDTSKKVGKEPETMDLRRCVVVVGASAMYRKAFAAEGWVNRDAVDGM